MAKMRVVQVSRAKGPLELVERELPTPGAGTVRIKVQACGICHSDTLTRDGGFPGMQLPRVPGHELIGVVDALGSGVTEWTVGQRVGVGWHGGSCGACDACRRGDMFACLRASQVTGISYDGGYGEYMVAPTSAVAAVPEGLSAVEAAPLMCAGVTTFNALRNSGARGGEVVAVVGLGGLGHLAVQFAAKMGFHTVAIARGKDKEALARQMGAHHYIDSRSQDPVGELNRLGGAKVILATVTDGDAMSAVVGGLAINGTLMVIGVPPELRIPVFPLIMGRRAIKGWYAGTSIDSEDTLKFCVLSGVRSMNEVFPLDRVSEAYNRMLGGEARFRVVLTMGQNA
jgi:D-arabinose 1-dehydrogenase-like Zn-dependent alcohol dehydrogenase